MNKKVQLLKYLVSDFITAASIWTLFYIIRKIYIESIKFGYEVPIEFGQKFILGLIFIPLFWLLLYYTTGYYKRIYRKSRLKELGQTVIVSVIGVTIIFFVLILDDEILSYKTYYFSYFTLLGLHFGLTYFPRLVITSQTNHKIHNRIIGFNTLIIGSNEKAVEIYKDFESHPQSAGNKFVGFINIYENGYYHLGEFLPHLGDLNDLKRIIRECNIEEVIIALETNEHESIGKILNRLDDRNVIIRVIPDMYDILTGQVKMSSLYGAPLIQISHDIMPVWQENLKRVIDIVVSLMALVLLSPLYLFLTIGVKLSSPGPVMYSHERIGMYEKPFTIFKFRSMYKNAEKDGPALSSKDDPRVTPFGRFMRKSRLDELPQFYNVLIGDMSLVGPRPERQFFIDQIVKQAPHYVHLLKVRPGITSWGQVKFGYAENVDEMIKRLKYDIIYIENMSLYVDLKIMIYTVRIILQRSGK
ncbi:MAG: sugar transferase [Bacteroidetes bacterium]|nr:sugar transferase [Bacteroidota bacterium]